MDSSRIRKTVLDGKFNARRPVGRPRLRWESDVRRNSPLLLVYIRGRRRLEGVRISGAKHWRCRGLARPTDCVIYVNICNTGYCLPSAGRPEHFQVSPRLLSPTELPGTSEQSTTVHWTSGTLGLRLFHCSHSYMTIHSQFIHLSLKYMWPICIQSARIISNTINLYIVITCRCHRRRKGESEYHTSFGARQYQHCAETYWPASTLVKSRAPDNTR